MNTESSQKSLRYFTFLFTGVCLAVFAALLFGIFYSFMPRLLENAEDLAANRRKSTITALFRDDLHRTFVIADDIASRKAIAAFAKGEYPGYIEELWPESPPLATYGFTFLLIKDKNGKDLYREFINPDRSDETAFPEALARHLAPVAAKVASSGDGKRDQIAALRGKGGIALYDGIPCIFAVMPITDAVAGGKPEGTVTIGNVLDNRYFQGLTCQNSFFFKIISSNVPAPGEHELSFPTSETFRMLLPLSDIHGAPLALEISGPRFLHARAKSLLAIAALLLLAGMAAFTAALYTIIQKLVLRPVETLDKDLATVSTAHPLQTEKYSTCAEFANLSTSINNMLHRLQQSNVSIDIFERILSGTDAMLYVTDAVTNEILFVNGTMMGHFGLTESVNGKECWKVFQKGQTGPCPFCPVPQLKRQPDQPVVWEEKNPITGRYYRNTGSLTEWSDGRLAHLQHRVDISDIKMTEANLKKRLEQQEVTSAIAQSFIGKTDTKRLINRALALCGEFMRASRVLLAKSDQKNQLVRFDYEWTDRDQDIDKLMGTAINFSSNAFVHNAFIKKNASFIAYDDVNGIPELSRFAATQVIGFIDVPIYVEGNFWGIFGVEECRERRRWSESDIHLVRLVGSLISGLLTRVETEKNLVRMSSIVDSSPRYIAYLSPEGEFEYINKGALDLLGYTREELKHDSLAILFDDATRERIRKEIIPAILHDGQCEFELPVRRKDGEIRFLSFSGFSIGTGSPGIGTIAFDLTEKRQMESEAVKAKEMAELSSKAKGEFLSRMSHEIRTPLNAIIGMTDIAKTSPDLERKAYCLDKIEIASTHLLGVINDILDMSKIEANKFELLREEFIIEKMLIRVVNVINFPVEEKKLSLIVNMDNDLPVSIVSDEQRLAQVITNLLSNAVKFTPENGVITLRVSKLGEEDGECTLQVDVTDTGIGISAEAQNRLFSSFEQANGGIAKKFGGTGLGLAISRSIVEILGGRIWVASEEGKGSTFSFTFRAKRGAATSGPRLSPDINWQNLRVLAVDDAEEIREFFTNFAKCVHLTCDVTSNGKEAFALIEANEDTPYNIIFVDWKMPGMNGIEFTRKIKGHSGDPPVVIMISAMEWNMVEKEAKAAGVDKFMPKPLFPSMIVDCINQCLHGPGPATHDVAAKGCTKNCYKGKRILLVEDIEINREIVASLLEHTGVAIDMAENGLVALKAVSANPGAFDMVFMDVHMPEMDGYEATRAIRALPDPGAQALPIIAMTANVFREDIEKCLASGMNGHVGKPVTLADMMEKMDQYLS